jgi:hypothetical protein
MRSRVPLTARIGGKWAGSGWARALLEGGSMTYRSLCIGALAILSSASRASADTASQPRKPPAVPNDAVSAPAIDQEARRAFREIVKRDLAEPTVAKALKGYSISPTLTQLRRYIEPGTGETRTVCMQRREISTPAGASMKIRSADRWP